MIGKLEEGRTVISVAAEFGINKRVISRAWKAFQTTGKAVSEVGGTVRGRQLQGTADILSCMRKEVYSSQQASLLSNCLQHRGDKCRGLLWQTPSQRGPIRPPS
ncbi:uncharacterized protein TNCV_2698661 [Trichonephila clavipes]|nr:uncharacterized protein TNCV_2698661 [Trichonephila clavipes]